MYKKRTDSRFLDIDTYYPGVDEEMKREAVKEQLGKCWAKEARCVSLSNNHPS